MRIFSWRNSVEQLLWTSWGCRCVASLPRSIHQTMVYRNVCLLRWKMFPFKKNIYHSLARGSLLHQEICSNISKIYRLIKVITVCREEREAYQRSEELQISVTITCCWRLVPHADMEWGQPRMWELQYVVMNDVMSVIFRDVYFRCVTPDG
jgi:hypothetical protein